MKDSREDVRILCSQLEESTQLKRNGRCIKYSNNAHNTNVLIDSWKFQDFDYGKDKVVLPIQARGLFTVDNESIVVRGYDKFFNVGEKPFTKEEHLVKNTAGPYHVTFKENGCIIFIGGLATGDIVVCSKHSTGARDDNTRNHALEGEMQLKRQVGDDRVRELARYLYENSLTAVAELCDDEFEEHVLAYPKDKAGLYLHGLNHNTIKFQTAAIANVVDFAHQWGFKVIEHLEVADPAQLFDFLHKCDDTGTYNGRELEGFVIRCKHRHTGDDFFFKYKFEEPYLLYRQFREGTRQMLEGVPINSIKMKKNKYITKQYLEFAQKLFEDEPTLKEKYLRGHGIIHVRQSFLEYLQETNGMNLLSLDAKLTRDMKELHANSGETTRYLFVPIATIGCGKTTVFNTLSLLFPQWKHIQNDNIAKGAKLKITDLALAALDDHPVVLLDRNNSEFRERKQIFSTVAEKRNQYLDDVIDIKFIGINFIDDVSQKELWDITFGRIKKRGDNHQSIKSQSDESLAAKIMRGFINRFQAVNTHREPDCQFDHVINLKLTQQKDSSLENVKLIIKNIARTYPALLPASEVPSNDAIDASFQASLDYKPTFTKDMGSSAKNKNKTKNNNKKEPVFYGIDVNRAQVLESLAIIAENEEYVKLQQQKLVQDEFHVTLGHVASRSIDKDNKRKWKQMVDKLGTGAGECGKNKLEFLGDVKMHQVVINNGKLVCVKSEIVSIRTKNGVETETETENKTENKTETEINTKTEVEIEPLNKQIHITVGCFPPTKAVESNSTLEELYKNDDDGNAVLKKDGTYTIGEDTLVVKNFEDPILVKQQQLFAFF
ncbi:uncharacterized protein LODBEIA_P58960 [Lodderomyces beijingensis]|uniref:tRNA ligase n=1 Tax=Lodderomyces beijingensis TaxID=1775926 RepID=A0ABP0ZWS1_9ASCO